MAIWSTQLFKLSILEFWAAFSKDQNRCDTYFPMLFNEECKQQIALVLEIRLITLNSGQNRQWHYKKMCALYLWHIGHAEWWLF